MSLIADGNTVLEVIDTDRITVLASNDDRAEGDQSSLINGSPGRTDLYYVHVNHAPDVGVYGAYDLVVTANNAVDNDGDGFDTTTDCNDDDPAINPDAIEVCDGVDQDCDGVVDSGFDVDGDGFSTCGGDCDDTNASVNPDAPEVPANGIDDNCNGEIDELSGTDVVTITRAEWKKEPKKLIVEDTTPRTCFVSATASRPAAVDHVLQTSPSLRDVGNPLRLDVISPSPARQRFLPAVAFCAMASVRSRSSRMKSVPARSSA